MNEQSATTQVSWAARADDGAVADFIAGIVAQPGPLQMAVPGGRTPLPIFADLCRRSLPWGTVTMMLTDDRIVPASHPASNQGKLEQAFDATAAQIETIEKDMAVPTFDLVWIGMGADGHIASLFPVMQARDRPEPAVIETEPEPLPAEAPFRRLSLNMPALANARAIMLVIRGEEKKRVIESAIAGENDLPVAQLLRRAHCPVTIFWSA